MSFKDFGGVTNIKKFNTMDILNDIKLGHLVSEAEVDAANAYLRQRKLPELNKQNLIAAKIMLPNYKPPVLPQRKPSVVSKTPVPPTPAPTS
jgi:hypothetical protein